MTRGGIHNHISREIHLSWCCVGRWVDRLGRHAVSSPDPTWQVAVGEAGGTRLYPDLFPGRLSSPQTITRPLCYLVHILSLGKSRNTPVFSSPDAARHMRAISRAQMVWILYVYICAWRGRGCTHRARGTYRSVAVNIETGGGSGMSGVRYRGKGE